MKWFKHDSDANRDARLEKILMRYGAEGYALYWLCLELIAAPIDKTNINFELEHDAEVLAYRLKIDSARVEEIMRYMIEIDLFEINHTTQRITCLKLANRLENSIVKNPQLKEIQQFIAEPNPGQSGIVPDHPGQPRKTSARTRSDLDKQTQGSNLRRFDEFWQAYPVKVAKKKTKAIWQRRKLDELADTIIANVQARKAHDPQWDRGFIPHPSTFLNGDRWEDEITQSVDWDSLVAQHARKGESYEQTKGRLQREKQ